MPQVYATWVCKTTKLRHRLTFTLRIGTAGVFESPLFKYKGVMIDDPAINLKSKSKRTGASRLRRYAIYVPCETPTYLILEALKEYINQAYTPENDTLTAEMELNE